MTGCPPANSIFQIPGVAGSESHSWHRKTSYRLKARGVEISERWGPALLVPHSSYSGDMQQDNSAACRNGKKKSPVPASPYPCAAHRKTLMLFTPTRYPWTEVCWVCQEQCRTSLSPVPLLAVFPSKAWCVPAGIHSQYSVTFYSLGNVTNFIFPLWRTFFSPV